MIFVFLCMELACFTENKKKKRKEKPKEIEENGNRRNGADGTRLSRHMRLYCIPVCFRQKHVHPEAQTPKNKQRSIMRYCHVTCNAQISTTK